MTATRDRLLFLDGDALFLRAATRVVSGIVSVVGAQQTSAADEAIALRKWAGYVIGAPFTADWIRRIRELGHRGPVMLLATADEQRLADTASRMGVTVRSKPIQSEALRAFAVTAVLHAVSPATPVAIAGALVRVAVRHMLSRGELEILASALSGRAPLEFAEEHRISTNTYKTRVRRLLRKVCGSSIGEVRDRVLRESHARAESP